MANPPETQKNPSQSLLEQTCVAYEEEDDDRYKKGHRSPLLGQTAFLVQGGPVEGDVGEDTQVEDSEQDEWDEVHTERVQDMVELNLTETGSKQSAVQFVGIGNPERGLRVRARGSTRRGQSVDWPVIPLRRPTSIHLQLYSAHFNALNTRATTVMSSNGANGLGGLHRCWSGLMMACKGRLGESGPDAIWSHFLGSNYLVSLDGDVADGPDGGTVAGQQ